MRLLILISLALVAYSTAQSCGTTPISPNLLVGTTSNAVVGGQTANPYSWPWNVAVCIVDWFSNCNFKFGGSIISSRWILTSASFLKDNTEKIGTFRVKAGVFDESSKSPVQEVQITGYFIHPNYDGLRNDIALIQLSSPLQFNTYIQPVCLPSDDDEEIQPGEYAWFTGWGYTTDYQFGSVTKELHQAQLVIDKNSVCGTGDTQLCVGTTKKTTCNFDLGSPLVQQPRHSNNWYQYGISSFRAKNCDEPSKFTRVSQYCSWIKSQTGVDCI